MRTCLLSGLACLLLLAPAAARADYIFEGWDTGSTAGWLQASGPCQIEALATGGLVGGYLHSYEPVFTYGIVGALNYTPDYAGDYAAHGYVRVQVAVEFQTGTFLSAYFHARYLDAMHNGWQLPLDVDLEATGWQLVHFDFDPTWSDLEAEAAGWVQESASVSFAETMANVFSAGVKATGTGTLSMGLDHFSLQSAETPAAPGTWGGVKNLYR